MNDDRVIGDLRNNVIIEKKQHEIATEAVQNMKDPIDKAKAVSAGEEERNKEINKAFGN